MAQPIVAYYTPDGANPVSRWDIGEIDANSVSPTLSVTVWNNKGGSTDVSHMKNVSVTCLDGNGGDSDAMVVEGWMRVSVNKQTAVSVGGTNKQSVRAIGLDESVGNLIYGTANDGTVSNSKNNFAYLDAAVKVPPNALEGLHNFKLRTEYFYV